MYAHVLIMTLKDQKWIRLYILLSVSFSDLLVICLSILKK